MVPGGYSFIKYKQKSKPLTMVPCGIFETRISANCLLKNGLHILCNQFRHTASQDLEVVTLILNKIYKQIPPVNHFLPMAIVKKQEESSIYFLISQGYINI